MKKEIITLDAVKQDFLNILKDGLRNQMNWRLEAPIPYSLLAISLGALSQNLWVALAVFTIPVYQFVRYVMEYVKYRRKKAAILGLEGRRQISVTTEIFSHIAEEYIYEPWIYRRVHLMKPIQKYYFRGGTSWREPESEAYRWSEDFHMSPEGLRNISAEGDEYFFILFRDYPDVAYIYPCDYFALDGFLSDRVAT